MAVYRLYPFKTGGGLGQAEEFYAPDDQAALQLAGQRRDLPDGWELWQGGRLLIKTWTHRPAAHFRRADPEHP